ncbi:hypothetical protein BH11PLA2_BH11PLA2_15300 [soil metagenome]
MRSFRLVFLILFVGPLTARAQYAPPSVLNGYYGLSGSPGVVMGPVWGYPYYSHVYGSFYSNGLSLYNMPVPQPGATPGAFGGTDSKRLLNTPPGLGLGWLGFRTPLPAAYGAARDFPQNPLPPGYTPRFATKDVKARYAQAAADPVGESYRQLANIGLLIFVPMPDCAITLQGQAMAGTGAVRHYESPKLADGSYTYTVVAKIDGKDVTKEVTGKPGETLTVDFRK